MNQITFVQYQNGAKVVMYTDLQNITSDIKTAVHRIVGNNELKKIQDMSLTKVKWVVDRWLTGSTLFDIEDE